MRLLGVEATDFLSYRRLDVDLTDVHQLAIIGKNGHGKSAILDAVLWCLFAKGRGSSDEMVREGASSMYVRTTWERITKDTPSVVTITRSRSKESDESSLSVLIDGEEKSKARIPQTQAYIEHLVGMGSKAMMAGPVMVQGDSAALLEAQPSARKDLLVELFQLERWEAYHEEAKRRRKMVQREQDATAAELSELDELLDDFDELAIQRDLLGMRDELAGHTEELERLREEVTTLREQAAVLQERSRRAQALASDADATLASLDRLDLRRRSTWEQVCAAEATLRLVVPDVPPEPGETEIEEIQRRIAAMDDEINQRKSERATVTGLQRQRATLVERSQATSPCEGNPPGCQYLLAAAEARRQLHELDRQIDAIGLRYTELDSMLLARSHWALDLKAAEKAAKAARAEHVRLATEAASIQARQVTAQSVLGHATAEYEAMTQEVETLRARHAELTAEKLRLQQDEWSMADLATQIQALTAEGVNVKDKVEELTKAIHATERRRDEMAKAVARRALLLAEEGELGKRAVTLDHLVKAFHRDGIPTLILETALPEIEGRANDVLSRLPDDYSIRLDTKTATKAGTFKDELRVTVMTGGRERPYHMLSGGQRFRVDFAMRIALAAVIAARVEATVDTLWLDEPLGPLDREGQEAVADTLAAVADDFGLIAVVSHVADFNDRFETKLSVSMEDGESVAVLS